MTKQEKACPKGPNNFAMVPRIAMIELNTYELTLYTNLVDLAHPHTKQAQLSNKRLASRVGCTIKTLKKHRDRLVELGYIRLFYQDQYDKLILIDGSTEVETHNALVVEIIDIWEANCRFAQVYKDTPEDKLAVLKNFLPAPVTDTGQGGKALGGSQLQTEPTSSEFSIEDREGGGTSLPGVENEIHASKEANATEGEVKLIPNIINKDLLQETENKNKKELIRNEREDDDFLDGLADIFAEDDEPERAEASESRDVEPETPSDTVGVPTDEPEQVDVIDLSCTPEEAEYFKDRVSSTGLESDVYNPCHHTSHGRSDFRQPTKQRSNWHQVVAVLGHFFPEQSTGYLAKLAQQFAGTAKSGQRKEFALEPSMNAVETCAFFYWLREGEGLDRLPERAERIQERAMQFRALPDHFEHVNFARYTLADVLAALETTVEPEPDPDLFKPAPKELLDKLYADAESLLGFSLSGDF